MGVEPLTPSSLAQAQLTASNSNLSAMEKLLQGLNNFFSKDDIDQKTYVEEINAIGMVEIETSNELMAKYLGKDDKGNPYIDRIAQKIVDRRRVNNKSIHGKGVTAMIDFVEAFSGKQEVKTEETSLDKMRRIT